MKDSLKLYGMAFNTALQAKFEYRVDFLLGGGDILHASIVGIGLPSGHLPPDSQLERMESRSGGFAFRNDCGVPGRFGTSL